MEDWTWEIKFADNRLKGIVDEKLRGDLKMIGSELKQKGGGLGQNHLQPSRRATHDGHQLLLQSFTCNYSFFEHKASGLRFCAIHSE